MALVADALKSGSGYRAIELKSTLQPYSTAQRASAFSHSAQN
jgi:hypothetical protein